MRLYHGTAKTLEGDTLNPSSYPQVKNGREGKWLFATHRIEQAELFSTPWMGFPDDMPLGGFLATATPDAESTLIVFITTNRQRFLDNIRGTIYSFPADGFERVDKDNNPSREWVSLEGINLFDEKTGSHTITSIDPMLEKNMQFFFVPSELATQFMVDFKSTTTNPNYDMRPAIGAFYAKNKDKVIWENAERNIGVDPILAESSRSTSLKSGACKADAKTIARAPRPSTP